jgi:predicted nucleotidyltransferase
MVVEVLGHGRISREVLALLVSVPGQELHTREIARRVGADAHPVQRALEQFMGAGLVQSRRLGNLRLWSARRTSPLIPAVRELLRHTSGIAEKLRQALAKMPRLHLAFLFGSYASGKDELGSDIDLFIVGDVDWEQLSALTTRLERDLGREINLVIWTLDQLERPSANQRKFLTNLLSRPRIWLLGDDDELKQLRSAVGAAVGASHRAHPSKPRRSAVPPPARGNQRATRQTRSRGRS